MSLANGQLNIVQNLLKKEEGGLHYLAREIQNSAEVEIISTHHQSCSSPPPSLSLSL
jgi:hypothetical protein